MNPAGPDGAAARRILLVGATGAFGRRLAVVLSSFPGVVLVLAARRREPLERLRAELAEAGGAAQLVVAAFDRRSPEHLAALSPWLVIDAAGPFQDSGYELALGAVNAGAHYIDLADARAFVAGFVAALDGPARAAGRVAATGASSTPALSHAALAQLVAGWRQVDEVTVAISPGARAPRGLSVVQAILSYVGQPVRVFSDGRWGARPGWSGLRRMEMPGLGRRWLALCETPDLDLLPATFQVRRKALFLAGLELAPMHLGLWLLAAPVRWGWMASLTPLAQPLRSLADLFAPLGGDRGGMIVTATGVDADGRDIVARWGLWAERNAGPNVPSAAAAAFARALLQGREDQSGARVCMGSPGLADILRELDHLPIGTRFDESHPNARALFRRLLGRRFDDLPAPVRGVHGIEDAQTFTGQALARVGRSAPAAALRLLLGLPRRGRHPAAVRIAPDAAGELWTRRFGPHVFASRLAPTARLGVFEERFGPLRFAFRIDASRRGVIWRFCGWKLWGLPLPAWAAPRMSARAGAASGRYRFSVAVAHPWLGLLFAYRGWLAVEEGAAAPACA